MLNILKSKKSTINYLELTPVRLYSHAENQKGLIDVLVPRFKSNIMQKIIPPGKDPWIRANLDELGSATWLLMDGNNKVGKISEVLNEQFGDKISPVEQRVTLFMTNLYQNGFISFKEIERKH